MTCDVFCSFQIHTPGSVILEIPADDMPAGWQVWDGTPAEIAESAANRLGLRVTVERREIATAKPGES
jgi:hypothetical protein